MYLLYIHTNKTAKVKKMTFQEAKKLAKKNKGCTYYYDAGNNCKGRVEWCGFRNRLICRVSNDGIIWF